MKMILFLVLGLSASLALAQDSRGRGPRGGGAPPEVVKECAAELGISLPEPGEGTIAAGSRPQISEENRTKLHQCLESKRPDGASGRHGGPSDAERQQVDACLTAKGITLPEPSEGAERPRLDEATRTALRECIEATRSSSQTTSNNDSSQNASLGGGVR